MPTAIDDDIVAQLEVLGAPDDVIAAARASITPVDLDCHVWEENWDTVMFFIEVGTQWRLEMGMAGLAYFGLEYRSVESVMNMLQIDLALRPDLFRGLRVMECAALPLLNKQHAR